MESSDKYLSIRRRFLEVYQRDGEQRKLGNRFVRILQYSYRAVEVEPTPSVTMFQCRIERLITILRDGCNSKHQRDTSFLCGKKHAGDHERPDHEGPRTAYPETSNLNMSDSSMPAYPMHVLWKQGPPRGATSTQPKACALLSKY